MPYLKLPNIDWAAVEGGSETDADWLADRDRKFGLIANMVARYSALADRLVERRALFEASPEVLAAEPDAADWYVSLAGFALNTLGNVKEAPEAHGLDLRVITVLKNLREGRSVAPHRLAAFCSWINEEIDELHPQDRRFRSRAISFVFSILGARAVGQGQNIGGEEGVDLLKTLLGDAMSLRGREVQIGTEGNMTDYVGARSVPGSKRILVNGRLLFDFQGGGSRPDLEVRDQGVVIAKSEVKARKDTSNQWESWMPQVEDHMKTWTVESPDAARLFFGTLVTQEMVEGVSRSGVARTGLKNLAGNGLLSAAYNLTRISAGHRQALASFEALVSALEARLDPPEPG